MLPTPTAYEDVGGMLEGTDMVGRATRSIGGGGENGENGENAPHVAWWLAGLRRPQSGRSACAALGRWVAGALSRACSVA